MDDPRPDAREGKKEKEFHYNQEREEKNLKGGRKKKRKELLSRAKETGKGGKRKGYFPSHF